MDRFDLDPLEKDPRPFFSLNSEPCENCEHVQLGDGPKQDLYTTVYIDAAKRCGVQYDFTSEVRP